MAPPKRFNAHLSTLDPSRCCALATYLRNFSRLDSLAGVNLSQLASHRGYVIRTGAPRLLAALCDALRPCSAPNIRHTQPSAFRHFYIALGYSEFSNRIRGVIFSTPRNGMAVATYRGCAEGGIRRLWKALPLIGSGPGPSPRAHPFWILLPQETQRWPMTTEKYHARHWHAPTRFRRSRSSGACSLQQLRLLSR